MASTSPAPRASRYPRASAISSSPQPSINDWLSPDRNLEKSHKEALAIADAEHRRIRERAEHVLWLHEEKEARNEIAEKARRDAERLRITQEKIRVTNEFISTEQKRVQAEKEAIERERRLRELKATQVAPLSPLPPQSAEPAARPAAAPVRTISTSSPSAQPAPPSQSALKSTPGALGHALPPKPAAASPFAAAKPAASAVTPASAAASVTPIAAPAVVAAKVDARKERALLIHKNLKGLRKSINDVQVRQNAALKNRAGDLRRELRKCVGQLSFDKKGNLAVLNKVLAVLKEGLANQVNSELIDPSHFVFDERHPVDGAANNDQLPSLFLFLLNHLAKCVINQFMDESSANTKTADPIGVLIASAFSDPVMHWRGKPLIDILIAKFYVVCPVLFGARGTEKTQQGRERVGWKRRGPNAWMPEAEHFNRQTGLGAGYAAIALRDFSKAKKQNPWPTSHYWAAMSQIVNTPPAAMSNTACTVLKAMIDHYEQRFLLFYGTAAIAALRLALVDFPTNAKSAGCGDVAVEALIVHGKTLKTKYGLALA